MMDENAVKEAFKGILKEQEERHQKEMAKLYKEQKAAQEITRQMKVQSEKNKYKNPSDKRPVEYLLQEQFDLQDFSLELNKLVISDGVFIDIAQNVEAVTAFLKTCIEFGNMRTRKSEKEIDDYAIANRAENGWLTTKFYNQESIFKNSGDQKWYEKTEKTSEEKTKLLRAAEREAYNAKRLKRQAGARTRPTRWDSSNVYKPKPAETITSGAKEAHFIPRYRVPPKDGSYKGCFACGSGSHFIADCPQKDSANVKREK